MYQNIILKQNVSWNYNDHVWCLKIEIIVIILENKYWK